MPNGRVAIGANRHWHDTIKHVTNGRSVNTVDAFGYVRTLEVYLAATNVRYIYVGWTFSAGSAPDVQPSTLPGVRRFIPLDVTFTHAQVHRGSMRICILYIICVCIGLRTTYGCIHIVYLTYNYTHS